MASSGCARLGWRKAASLFKGLGPGRSVEGQREARDARAFLIRGVGRRRIKRDQTDQKGKPTKGGLEGCTSLE